MAIIRMAASVGAALVALTAIVPATSQAQATKSQATKAPLQLVPGADQAKKLTTAGTTKKATPSKATRPTASNKKASRQNTAAVQPVSKAARTNSRTVANNRQNKIATNAQRGRSASTPRVIRAAVVPYLTATRPVLRRGTREPPIVARAPTAEAPQDRVMRGRDSVSLVGKLPWWRNDRMQAVNYGSVEAESKVIDAAAVWLAANGGEAQGDRPAGDPVARAPVDEAIEVADAGELNDIDLAAESDPSVPTPTFLQSLLALIGGAAVAAAASARLLFT